VLSSEQPMTVKDIEKEEIEEEEKKEDLSHEVQLHKEVPDLLIENEDELEKDNDGGMNFKTLSESKNIDMKISKLEISQLSENKILGLSSRVSTDHNISKIHNDGTNEISLE